MTIVNLYRDQIVTGAEVAYKAIEEDAARMCAELNCPHPHIAMESLATPREVWWLNTLSSEAERQRIVDAYQNNHPLMAALATIAPRKAGIATGVDIIAVHEPSSSRSDWVPGNARFVVGAIADHTVQLEGAVFVAADGKRIVLQTVRTREDAEAIAAHTGPDARAFVVRAYWGMPAREWIATDPEFWKPNPLTSVLEADVHGTLMNPQERPPR